jgi:hypothetical protein
MYTYSYILVCIYIVEYLLKVRTVELDKQPLLGNGCVTRNNGVTVGSSFFCTLSADGIQRGPAAITRQ